MKELDLTDFPPGTVTEYTTLVCLACIFDIFTKQIGLAPRSAYTEIKRYRPTVEELRLASKGGPKWQLKHRIDLVSEVGPAIRRGPSRQIRSLITNYAHSALHFS